MYGIQWQMKLFLNFVRVYTVLHIQIMRVQLQTRAFVACVSERTKKNDCSSSENYQLEVCLANRGDTCVVCGNSRAKGPSI